MAIPEYSFIVKGVIVEKKASLSQAIVRLKNRDQDSVLSVGSALGAGVKIKKIQARGIWIEHQNREKFIPISTQSMPSPPDPDVQWAQKVTSLWKLVAAGGQYINITPDIQAIKLNQDSMVDKMFQLKNRDLLYGIAGVPLRDLSKERFLKIINRRNFKIQILRNGKIIQVHQRIHDLV